MNHRLVFPLLLLLTLAPAGPTHAESPAYKSVDEHGTVTYSDRPPADAVQTETVEVEKAPQGKAVPDAEARRRQMEKQAESLAASRREREKAREKRAREKAPPKPATPPATPPASDRDTAPGWHDGYYWPGYPYRPPGYRPPNRPRPPIQRPPVRPPVQRPPAQPAPLPAPRPR